MPCVVRAERQSPLCLPEADELAKRNKSYHMKTCVILQPSFIPWRGYFHQVQRADVFVFYDDVQYDKHGWRNRNRVKTANGTQWLTVPVHSKGAIDQGREIREITIDWTARFVDKHLATIRQAYRKAPFFDRYIGMLENAYDKRPEHLADLTIDLTTSIAAELGLTTQFVRSSEMRAGGAPTERLVNIVRLLGCDHYISGPSAKDYVEEQLFVNANIKLEYMTYNYPEYPQLHPPFDPQVTILDLLFMTGELAPKYIWG